MAYTSWSVDPLEVPDADKWNILGLNDADFDARITALDTEVSDQLNTGWVEIDEAWTYASSSTITVPAGATNRFKVGDKLRFTNSGTKYMYVIGIASTTLTVTGGTDFTVANAAISDIYVSRACTPVGFPQIFAYAPSFSGGGTAPTYSTSNNYFRIDGGLVTVWLNMFNTSGGTAGSGAQVINISTPTNISSSIPTEGIVGFIYARESGGTNQQCLCRKSGSNTFDIGYAVTNTGNAITFNDQSSASRSISGQLSYTI